MAVRPRGARPRIGRRVGRDLQRRQRPHGWAPDRGGARRGGHGGAGSGRPVASVAIRGGAVRATLLLLVGLATIAAALAGGAKPAAAHAFLESSDPAANAVLPQAPAAATLRFSEPLERSYSRADLYDRFGATVPGATSRAGDDEYAMVLDLPPGVPAGTYTILWRSLSTADGHTATGYVTFTVGTTADVWTVVLPEVASATAPPAWLQAGARGLALLGLAGAVAVWPVWLLVLRPAISPAWQAGPELARRARRIATWSVALALLGSLLALALQADATDSGLWATLSGTRYGRIWALRAALLLAFAAALAACGWWWPRRRRGAAILALALAALLPLPFSLVAHAAAQPVGRTAAVAADVAHLLGASLWVGGLVVLAGALVPTLRALTPAGRRVVLSRALPRFSALALVAWAVLGLTGAYAAWLQVGNWTALRTTDYGRSLTLKVLLLVPLLLLGAFNLLVVTRRIRRARTGQLAAVWSGHFRTAVVAELALVAVVLLVVGRMIGQAPAREALAQRAGQMVIPLEAAGGEATLGLAPGATGLNHFRLEVGGDPLPAETRALIRLALPSQGITEQQLDLTRAAGNGFEWHGSELGLPGDWTFTVVVRQPGTEDWVATETLAIGTEPPRVDLPAPAWRFDAAAIPGLALIALGMAGVVVAWQAGRSPLRREGLGLGTVALAVGLVLVVQARVDPAVARLASANALPADQATVTRGRAIYQANCLTCHGPGGRGDGPAAASLDRPPADLTAGHAAAHRDEDMFFWVQNGIAGSPMPAFGGELSDAEIRDVLGYVRSLQGNAQTARDAPAPTECTVAPRTVEGIAAVAATPVAPGSEVSPPSRSAAPPGGPAATAPTPPAGTPADQATVAAVTAAIRERVACANARDTLRDLALFSDANIRQTFPKGPTDAFAGLVQQPGTPLQPELWISVVSVNDVRVLDDGRVAAVVTVDNPTSHTHLTGTTQDPATATQETAVLLFVPGGPDGRWLIDEIRY